MPRSDTGERVTEVLEFPSLDGLSVQAIRVDYEPGGFTAAPTGTRPARTCTSSTAAWNSGSGTARRSCSRPASR
jgi:hypothetical protein